MKRRQWICLVAFIGAISIAPLTSLASVASGAAAGRQGGETSGGVTLRLGLPWAAWWPPLRTWIPSWLQPAEASSAGSRIVVVPRPVGGVIAAYARLHSAGFAVSIPRGLTFDSLASPKVVRVVPMVGTRLRQGSVVTLYVSGSARRPSVLPRRLPRYAVPMFVGRLVSRAYAWASRRKLDFRAYLGPLHGGRAAGLLDNYSISRQRPTGGLLASGLRLRGPAGKHAAFRLTPLTVWGTSPPRGAVTPPGSSPGSGSNPGGTSGSGPPITAPANVSPPTISGSSQDGQTLTAGAGGWNGSAPLTYADHWLRCDSTGANCAAVAGANGQTYLLTPADVGSTIGLLVTATNVAGTRSASPPPTSVVAAMPPLNTSGPTISGAAEAGQTLSAGTGVWSGTPPLAYAYQWRRCDAGGGSCLTLKGATSSAYVLTSADVGNTLQVAVTASNAGGSVTVTSRQSGVVTAAGSDPLIAAAGDIACDPLDPHFNGGLGTAGFCQAMATSNLLVSSSFRAILPLGDEQYDCGSLSAFQSSYEPSWGRVKAISHPVPGNHEYSTSDGFGGSGCNNRAAGYFSYFGSSAGTSSQGYYSYDIGSWHIIALNTSAGCAIISCASGSAQETWLKHDLATHPAACTLAYWHEPLFSSEPVTDPGVLPFWQDLYAAGADVVLNGHAHNYERFALQSPPGAADPNGIREFVVGTGGDDLVGLSAPAANSQVRSSSTFGVLELTLHSDSYDWRFVRGAGASFTDSGSANCHH